MAPKTTGGSAPAAAPAKLDAELEDIGAAELEFAAPPLDDLRARLNAALSISICFNDAACRGPSRAKNFSDFAHPIPPECPCLKTLAVRMHVLHVILCCPSAACAVFCDSAAFALRCMLAFARGWIRQAKLPRRSCPFLLLCIRPTQEPILVLVSHYIRCLVS
jgi:hypothetical protein